MNLTQIRTTRYIFQNLYYTKVNRLGRVKPYKMLNTYRFRIIRQLILSSTNGANKMPLITMSAFRTLVNINCNVIFVTIVNTPVHYTLLYIAKNTIIIIRKLRHYLSLKSRITHTLTQ